LSSSKSEITKKLSNNYPNFLKRDLEKLINVFFNEMRETLKRNERIELRDVFSIETKLQKAKLARNPKTNEKIYIKEKYSILLKTSKTWSKRINEEK
tara:strand:+ start:52 stop:342 length:291 start_codon:yes stop_codon:yes gene_type:complete